MTLSACRLAIMNRLADINDVEVPPDPLPREINDKTIIVIPRLGPSSSMGRGKSGQMTFRCQDVVDVEYHRRIPYEHLGSVIGDVTLMIDTIRDMTWGEFASSGGRFDGTVFSVENVAAMHVGSLGWNEWTFGVRMQIHFTHLREVGL